MFKLIKRFINRIRNKLEEIREADLREQRRRADIADYWCGIELAMEEEFGE